MWPLLAEENTGRNWGKKGSLGYSEEIITFVGIKQGDKTSTFLFIILAYERIRSKILFFGVVTRQANSTIKQMIIAFLMLTLCSRRLFTWSKEIHKGVYFWFYNNSKKKKKFNFKFQVNVGSTASLKWFLLLFPIQQELFFDPKTSNGCVIPSLWQLLCISSQQWCQWLTSWEKALIYDKQTQESKGHSL